MAYLRRHKHILYLFLCGMAFFTLLFLSADDIQTEDDFDTSGIKNSESHRDIDSNLRERRNKNANGTQRKNAGLLVEIWPKDTLEIIEEAVQEIKRDKKRVGLLTSKQQHKTSVIEKPVPISTHVAPCLPDNTDCLGLRQLLRNWPAGKPKAAFYLLTQSARLGFLKKLLKSIDTYFNKRFQYPIVIFHEAELVSKINRIRTFSSSQLFFQEIVFTTPDFIGEIPEKIPCYSKISYRHMCRFHAKSVFEQPILRGLDYYWRLDDDSLLLREVSYDVFRFMRDKSLLYGYIWRHLDNLKCTAGLWNATHVYVKDNHIVPEYLSEWRDPWLYYNNFEITALSVWLSQDYAKYIEYIDRLGGIYYHRWGDAPIRGLALSMFVPKDKLFLFSDIHYRHGSFTNSRSKA